MTAGPTPLESGKRWPVLALVAVLAGGVGFLGGYLIQAPGAGWRSVGLAPTGVPCDAAEQALPQVLSASALLPEAGAAPRGEVWIRRDGTLAVVDIVHVDGDGDGQGARGTRLRLSRSPDEGWAVTTCERGAVD